MKEEQREEILERIQNYANCEVNLSMAESRDEIDLLIAQIAKEWNTIKRLLT